MMTDVKTCEKCGTKLDRESELPCPGCLMKLGMANWGQSFDGTSELPETEPPMSGESIDNDVAAIVESQFPGLEISDLLGEGGMGMVFKACQTSLDREVALKVIKTNHKHREAFENRFTREAKALASLNHPNIVTVHDFGKTDDYFFLMMEFVDGINLRELLAGQKISPREALEIIPQICDALQYAHEKGVVHRDIKPENILVDKNGRVKIADYGLAKLVNDESSVPSLTRTHHVMGTPHYMAPEQVEKPLSVDHRADIYSLGVVIYEMLTGELPLGRFDPPSEKARVDSRLDQIVLQTLEKEPARRYQKVSEIKTDFQSAMVEPQADPYRERVEQQVAAAQQSPVNRSPQNPSIVHPSPGHPPQGYGVPAQPIASSPQKPWPVQQPLASQANSMPVNQTGQPFSHQAAPHQHVPHQPVPGTPGPQKPVAVKNPYESATATMGVWASIFSMQTYLNAGYLMISFPLGIICFVLAMVGLSAGIPLTMIWIGFFVLFGCFYALQALFAVERNLCRWMLGEEIYYRSPARDHTSHFKKFTAILTDRSTWWGILYCFIKFPWSIICFVLTLVFFTVPLFLLAAPILITQWWFDMDVAGIEINSVERAIGAALLGLPIFYLGIQITNGLAFVSKKMSKFFLSRV